MKNRVILVLVTVWWALSIPVQAQMQSMVKELSAPATSGSPEKSKISHIELINNTIGDSVIGVMPSAVQNTRVSFIAGSGLESFIRGYADKVVAADLTNGLQVLWVINDFAVGIDSLGYGNIQSFVKISADVYVQRPGGYRLVGLYDTVAVVKEKIPVEQLAGKVIDGLAVFSVSGESAKSMTDVAIRSASGRVRRSLSEDNITGLQDIRNRISAAANDLPVLKVKNYVYGVYRSFEEFKNNSPSLLHFTIDVDTVSSGVKIFELNIADSTKKEVVAPWGLSVGSELYKYDNGQLYAIEKSGNFFALSKYLDPLKRENQAVYWRQAVGSRLHNDNPYDDEYLIRKPAGKQDIKLEAIKLDRTTGEIIL